jgi:hypothetical protein
MGNEHSAKERLADMVCDGSSKKMHNMHKMQKMCSNSVDNDGRKMKCKERRVAKCLYCKRRLCERCVLDTANYLGCDLTQYLRCKKLPPAICMGDGCQESAQLAGLFDDDSDSEFDE